MLKKPRPRWPVLVIGFLLAAGASEADAQIRTQQVSGVVRDFASGRPLQGVTVRVQGSDRAVHTAADGRFLLPDVPAGVWTLEIDAAGYGARTYAMDVEPGGFAEVEIMLTTAERAAGAAAAERDPEPPTDPVRQLGHVVEADAIRAVVGSVPNLGELVRRTIPTLRAREVPGVVGLGLCLEFRSAGPSRGPGSLTLRGEEDERFTCHGPAVYVDGVQVQDASFAYGMTALGDVRRLQAIPPAEAGVRFGAAPYGVLLVETRFMAARAVPADAALVGSPEQRAGFVAARRSAFDWSQDPAGHSFGRAFLGAFAGNAIGLAAGLAVGRRCVFIEDRTREIEFSCGDAGVAGVGVAAVALPALGSALGAHWGGRTQASVGRFLPALAGGAMGAVPGYIFALSTVGDGVQTMNAVGKGFLILGGPLLTTFADRLFRKLRETP